MSLDYLEGKTIDIIKPDEDGYVITFEDGTKVTLYSSTVISFFYEGKLL